MPNSLLIKLNVFLWRIGEYNSLIQTLEVNVSHEKPCFVIEHCTHNQLRVKQSEGLLHASAFNSFVCLVYAFAFILPVK